MGRRPIVTKGSEKRPKNWDKEHRQAYLEGVAKILSNDKEFLKKIGWDYDEPDFKISHVIDVDTSKVHSKVWNVSTGRGLKGKNRPKHRTEEKRIPGGSAFNGLWCGNFSFFSVQN